MNENKTNINFFPGHMAKTRREIGEKLKLIDIVYEVVDARIPYSSRIVDIDDLIKDKPKVIIMTKKDLCDIEKTNKWISYYESLGYKVFLVDLINDKSLGKLFDLTDSVLSELNEKREEKGLLQRKYRALIMGVPNVGKSTLINKITGKKATNVGDKPGVTKSISWVRINDKLELMDTPGILWPKIENQTVALNLASFSSIKDEILPIDEVACYILKYMYENYPERLIERYGLDYLDEDDYTDAYELIGRKRGCIIRGNEVDYNKVSNLIIRDLREGYLGKVTFDERV
ncbi:MAG: ribosome biogenesis GTPase YlqF [Bacilli bacterium]|nr:ribosome biogenesis GTPase YlqF [Bacilli bacterium]